MHQCIRNSLLQKCDMRKYALSTLVILLAVSIRIWFVSYTNYTAEDAHITFQFARNVMRGDGFALNPGQPIYGSTTPLLTFMLSGWLLVSKDIVLGARIIDLAAVAGGMIFLFLGIQDKRAALIALFIMALSARLYAEEMQGMEMPLLFLFMTMSFYGFVKQRPYFSGFAAGLMLWTRVDAVIWVGCLFVIYAITDYHGALKYFFATTAIYLPWIIFSWVYFGSPIPFTIIAKQVAYGIGNPSYPVHLQRIVDYVNAPILICAFLSIGTILKERRYWVFPLFILVEGAQLILTGSTFFTRYFYLLTLVSYILLALGLGVSIEKTIMRPARLKRYLLPILFLFIYVFSLNSISGSSVRYKRLQDVRQGILTQMGIWLNTNTPPGTTVLLEPLGYVGWYADRTMIDEVGLVTPRVVELKRLHVPAAAYYQAFWPNYVIWTCGEGGKWRVEMSKYYQIVKIFDGHSSRACYEIWQRYDVIHP